MKTTTAILLMLSQLVGTLRVMAQTPETHSFLNLNRAIPDGDSSGLSDMESVSSTIGSLGAVRVKLHIAGEFNGDLYVYLRHIHGNTTNFCVLLNRVGRTASNPSGYADPGLDVTFDQIAANGNIHTYQAVTNLPDGAPLTGTWQPDGRNVDPANVLDTTPSTTTLSSFSGTPGSGEWTLYLADLATGGTNQLVSWELELNGIQTPTVTWAAPADITYGTALGSSQLNASTPVPGTFTYSPPAGTVLNAGNDQILTAVFTPTDTGSYLPVTNTVSLNVLPAPLTITAQSKTSIYGAALPELTAQYSGFVNGDTTNDFDVQAVLHTTAIAGSPAGDYPITVDGASDANYQFTYVAATLTINKKALTVAAQNQSKTYGQSDPAFTVSYSGFITGENASDLGGTLTFSRASGEAVGTYTVTPGGLTSINYAISYQNGTLTINRKALTVTAVDQSKTYGDADPAFTASYAGFITGEDSSDLGGTLTFSRASGEAVGTYAITPAGLTSPNYSISFQTGTLTINQKALTVTAVNKTKTYGDTDPTFTASYSGFITGEDASDLGGTLTFSRAPGETAGTYAITPAGLTSPNYAISYQNGTLTINPKALTVTAQDKTKTYGDTDPAFTATYSGFISGENSSVLGGTLTFSRASGEAAGTYAIMPAGLTSPNYAISFQTGTLTINPKTLTVTAVDESKTYGAADPTFTATYSGFISGENSSVLGGTLTFSRAPGEAVGTYAITPAGLTSLNYSISYQPGTLTINRKALTVTAVDKSKTYGDADPAFAANYSGFISGEDASDLGGTLTFSRASGEDVGTYSITPAGLTSPNYSISYQPGTLTINRKALTVTAVDKSKTYGDADPAFTANYSGFITGENASVLSGTLTFSRAPGEAVGTYAITPAGLTSPNYSISFQNGNLTINQKTLTVSAQDKSKTYGQTDPTFTATYSGFISGENASVLGGTLTFSRAPGEAVGTYAISPAGLTSLNYAINFQNGTLTINKAGTTGLVSSLANPALPGQNVQFTCTLSAIAPGAGTPTGTVQFKVDGVNAGSPAALSGGTALYSTTSLAVGTHSVTAEYAGDGNFTGSTSSLSPQQLINTPPVAAADTIERWPDSGVKVAVTTLLGNDTDADGDAISLVSVSPTSDHDGSVSLSNGWVFYQPPAGFTNADAFTYTISDGRGDPVTGQVNVDIIPSEMPSPNLTISDLGSGSFLIQGDGIPGRTYRIQYTENVNLTDWHDLGSSTADEFGTFQYTDSNVSAARWYRSVYP